MQTHHLSNYMNFLCLYKIAYHEWDGTLEQFITELRTLNFLHTFTKAIEQTFCII